jgi:hypothetical protein
MNARAIGLMAALGLLLLGWLVVIFWPGDKTVTIEVKQLPRSSAALPTQQVVFGFDPELELTLLEVSRLDEATEQTEGMLVTMSDGPGPVWRLIPQDDREASEPTRVVRFGRRGRNGMQVDLPTTGLDPGIRYQITVKAKGGWRGQAEFIAEPNPRAQDP